MSTTDLIMLIGIAIVAALTVANNRSGIANKALEASVSNTQQISTFFGQMQTQALAAADEKGFNRAQLAAVKDDLREERDRNRQLNEKLTTQKAENQLAMDDLRKKLGQLEAEIREIRPALEKVTAEKLVLEHERDTLRTNYTSLEASIDQRILEAVEEAKADLNFKHEARVREKDNLIAQQVTEINRLKDQLTQRGQSHETNPA